MKRIVILTNTLAGKGKGLKIASRLKSILSFRKISFEIFIDDWPNSIDEFSDCFLVGGDGTFNYFLNRYGCCKVSVTLYDGGSGNDFFRHISGKKTVEECIEVGLNDEVKFVDVGLCNDRFFINGVGVGFDGQVVHSMQSETRFKLGRFSYLFSVLKEIVGYRPTNIIIETKTESIKGNFFMLSIANGSQYGGGFKVSPNSRIDDQHLNLVIIENISISNRVRYLPLMLKGKHLTLPFVKEIRLQSITINSSEILFAHLDGELMLQKEYKISVHSEKLMMKY